MIQLADGRIMHLFLSSLMLTQFYRRIRCQSSLVYLERMGYNTTQMCPIPAVIIYIFYIFIYRVIQMNATQLFLGIFRVCTFQKVMIYQGYNQ